MCENATNVGSKPSLKMFRLAPSSNLLSWLKRIVYSITIELPCDIFTKLLLIFTWNDSGKNLALNALVKSFQEIIALLPPRANLVHSHQQVALHLKYRVVKLTFWSSRTFPTLNILSILLIQPSVLRGSNFPSNSGGSAFLNCAKVHEPVVPPSLDSFTWRYQWIIAWAKLVG